MRKLQAADASESHGNEAQYEFSARKYQRFLEEELGQLLLSHAPSDSSQLSGRHRDRRFQGFDKQPSRQPVPSQPDQGSLKPVDGQLVCADGQVGLADGQAKACTGKYDRHWGPCNPGYGMSKQQLQQAVHRSRDHSNPFPSRTDASFDADSPQQTQPGYTQHSKQSRSHGPATGHEQSRSVTKSAHNRLSVFAQQSQHSPSAGADEQLNLQHSLSIQQEGPQGFATSIHRGHAWQAAADPEVAEQVPQGLHALPGDSLSPQQRPGDSSRDAEDSKQKMWRHAASHMRGISPQRRQLLLQSKFALFDSDSSSSDDDSWSAQKVIVLSLSVACTEKCCVLHLVL